MRVHSHWRVPFDLPFILAKRCSCLNTTKVNISNFKKQDTWSNPPNNHLQIYSLQARLLVQGSTILPPVVGLQVTFPAAAEGFAGAAFLHSLGPNYSWWWMRNKTIRVGYVKGEKKKKTPQRKEKDSLQNYSPPSPWWELNFLHTALLSFTPTVIIYMFSSPWVTASKMQVPGLSVAFQAQITFAMLPCFSATSGMLHPGARV